MPRPPPFRHLAPPGHGDRRRPVHIGTGSHRVVDPRIRQAPKARQIRRQRPAERGHPSLVAVRLEEPNRRRHRRRQSLGGGRPRRMVGQKKLRGDQAGHRRRHPAPSPGQDRQEDGEPQEPHLPAKPAEPEKRETLRVRRVRMRQIAPGDHRGQPHPHQQNRFPGDFAAAQPVQGTSPEVGQGEGEQHQRAPAHPRHRERPQHEPGHTQEQPLPRIPPAPEPGEPRHRQHGGQ